MITTTLTGHDAIRHATEHGITLSKRADPTEGARDGLSVEAAREIAREDPALIYVADAVRCECGDADGSEACEWTGPRAETVIVEYMPKSLRASHEAAGNRGTHPANGSLRLRCEVNCAAGIVEHSDGWATIDHEIA